MKDHVSGRGTTLSVLGSPDHSRAARWNGEHEREKEKVEDDPKGPEERSLQAQGPEDPEWWQEEDLVWWSKGTNGKNV